MSADTTSDLADIVGANLPYLRRYARALTGSQDTGDRFAAATLEAILTESDFLNQMSSPKVGLFRAFHVVWSSAGAPLSMAEDDLSARAQHHMAHLTANSREALLLNSIEGFTTKELAEIMDISRSEADDLLDVAQNEMQASMTGRVMIIEDEPIIAVDLQSIVTEMGHDVTGIARTRTEAIALAQQVTPDLILADIQLADKSSGIDAVRDILELLGERPVIFITAFPERLLTGARHEPAFLITKPFDEDQVRSAVSQAMFFASTQTLNA